MANSVKKTIEIIFAGTDNLSSSINTISNKMESMGDGMQDFGQPFADATEKVGITTAAIAAMAIAGIKASSDIESESKKMQNSLGLPTAEAERFQTIAKEVYKAGFGDDLVATFDAVTMAQKKFGDSAEVDIGKVTEQAFKLQKTFGLELNESMGAVNTLMDNFGLTAGQAFDFITTGFQEGLNGSDDFIESINEYSTQFANGGADAGDFFSVMRTGFQEGMLGTDRAADMFKEFRVRIQDGSKTTKEALESIGIDPVAFEANMASGKMSAKEAFDIIQAKLNETENSSVQLNAGVGLMGTQFEDMGTKAALAVNTTSKSIQDMEGALANFDTGSFEKKFTSLIRTITTEFAEQQSWKDAKEKLGVIFEDIAASFGPALENVDLSGMETAVGEVWDRLQKVLSENDLDITSVEGMQNAMQLVVNSIQSVIQVAEGVLTAFEPIFDAILSIAKGFNDLDPDVKKFAGTVMGLGTALVSVGGVVKVGGVLLSGLGSFAGMFTSGGVLATGITAMVTLLTGPAGLAIGVGALATAIAGFSWKSMNDEHEATMQQMEKTRQKIEDISKQIKDLPSGVNTIEIWAAVNRGDLDEAQKLIDEITKEEKNIKIKADIEEKKLDDLAAKMNGIPEEKRTEYQLAINEGNWEKVMAMIAEASGEKSIIVNPEVDSTKAKQATEKLSYILGMEKNADGKWVGGTEYTVEVPVKTDGIEKAKEEIKTIPKEKELEIKLQGEIDTEIEKIKSAAETAQAAFKYKAEIDIADIEAFKETTKSAFESVNTSISSTADLMGQALGSLGDAESFQEKWAAQDILKDEAELREKSFKLQKQLIDAQVQYMNARTEAMENGESEINISCDGLEPILEMLLWEVVEKVQVKANENAAEFLVGIT